MQFALAKQHGVTKPVCETAKELLGEVAELDSLGSRIPQQAGGVGFEPLPSAKIPFAAGEDALQNQGIENLVDLAFELPE